MRSHAIGFRRRAMTYCMRLGALAWGCCVLALSATAQTRPSKAVEPPAPSDEQRAALDAQLGSAALSGDLSLLEEMLREGADLEAHDPLGRTVLMLALTPYAAVPGTERVPAAAQAERRRQTRKLQIAATLIRRGADVTRQSAVGMTALHYAVLLPVEESAALEMVRALIRKKAPLDARMGEGVTPLRMAVDRGRARIARVLADAGADPRAADQNGTTPLSRALEVGPSALAKRLAAQKAGSSQRRGAPAR
jgi:uncharacterized protein